MPFFMNIVAMWHILFFFPPFDYLSELSPTHPQSDVCESPNQSAQDYSLFLPVLFLTCMYVAGLGKKDFYNINVFLFQSGISAEPLFFTVIV